MMLVNQNSHRLTVLDSGDEYNLPSSWHSVRSPHHLWLIADAVKSRLTRSEPVAALSDVNSHVASSPCHETLPAITLHTLLHTANVATRSRAHATVRTAEASKILVQWPALETRRSGVIPVGIGWLAKLSLYDRQPLVTKATTA